MTKHQALIALIDAAESARDWLVEANLGTDQRERGEALAKALRAFKHTHIRDIYYSLSEKTPKQIDTEAGDEHEAFHATESDDI